MKFSRPGLIRMPRGKPLVFLCSILLAAIILTAGVLTVRQSYNNGLTAVSNNQTTQIFKIEKGSALKVIASDLKEENLIRNTWAFQLYVHKKDLSNKLQAGTFALSPSQDVADIVETLTGGKKATKLVTILPGVRIDQVRANLINSGFSPADVDKALEPAQYADIPVVAFRPPNVNSLEGLLWPDSWGRDINTVPSDIIRLSLQAMSDRLTPDVQAAFAAQGLSPYQGLILASIVLQEAHKPGDQAQVAQVFLSRLKAGKLLESDATAKYGAVLNGQAPSVLYDSVYNSYKHAGLPPTPISSVNATSFEAVAHPAGTNWLYFVAGDDGTTHFSTNLKDHEALTARYCKELCGN